MLLLVKEQVGFDIYRGDLSKSISRGQLNVDYHSDMAFHFLSFPTLACNSSRKIVSLAKLLMVKSVRIEERIGINASIQWLNRHPAKAHGGMTTFPPRVVHDYVGALCP